MTDDRKSLFSTYYLGVEPAGNPGEGTTVSVMEYALEPAMAYKVRYLQRFPPGSPFPMVVDTLTAMKDELKGGVTVLNNTFVGDPVKNLFAYAGLFPISLYISGTETAIIPHVENAVDPLRKYDKLSWKVPYRDIVSVLQVAFQQGHLQIAPDLDLAQSLIDEILNFKLEVTPAGTIQKLRVDANADLLLSVAISVYVAARFGGNQIPIENMTAGDGTGTPDILDDDARKMPKVWEGEKAQMNTEPRQRIKYMWAQPGRETQRSSNLPGLM